MKYLTQTYRPFGLVALILSLAIVSAASAAEKAFTNTNDPAGGVINAMDLSVFADHRPAAVE